MLFKSHFCKKHKIKSLEGIHSMKKIILLSFATVSLSLSGCTGLLVGGAVAGGAAVVSAVHDRRSTGTVIDDRTLQRRILQKIGADKYLDSYSHVNVAVFNGLVLVTGEASSAEVAQRILGIVNSVPNIKRVESDIFIGAKSGLYSRGNDATITAKIKTALLSLNLPKFDPSLINVNTERGNVYLMGIVTRNEANAIAQKTSQVAGVKSVTKVFEYVDSIQ